VSFPIDQNAINQHNKNLGQMALGQQQVALGINQNLHYLMEGETIVKYHYNFDNISLIQRGFQQMQRALGAGGNQQ